MWWIIGGVVIALYLLVCHRVAQDEKAARKRAFEQWRDNFPGWGE